MPNFHLLRFSQSSGLRTLSLFNFCTDYCYSILGLSFILRPAGCDYIVCLRNLTVGIRHTRPYQINCFLIISCVMLSLLPIFSCTVSFLLRFLFEICRDLPIASISTVSTFALYFIYSLYFCIIQQGFNHCLVNINIYYFPLYFLTSVTILSNVQNISNLDKKKFHSHFLHKYRAFSILTVRSYLL